MPTIKRTAEGKIITKGGKPSCACCICCNFEIVGIGAFVVAYLGDTGYFTIQNNCASTIIVTSYNGVGSPYPSFPQTIAAGASANNLIFFFAATWQDQPFSITVEGCEPITYYWPSNFTGAPPWL